MTPDASRTSRGPNSHVTSAPPSRPPAWPLQAGQQGRHRLLVRQEQGGLRSLCVILSTCPASRHQHQPGSSGACHCCCFSLTNCLCALTSGCRPRLWPASCPAAAAQPHCAAPCCACGASRTRPERHPDQTEQLQAHKGRRGTTHAHHTLTQHTRS